MSMFAKVRRMFHRDHLSISEIQRRTSLSRNTIKASSVDKKRQVFAMGMGIADQNLKNGPTQ